MLVGMSLLCIVSAEVTDNKNKEMNFSNKTCLLCLENHDNLLEICGKQGTDLNVGTIVQEHFWFEVGTFAAKNICENCWKKVESFHIFYNFVKSIHQLQTCETKAIIDNGLVYSIKEEPVDIKEVFDVFGANTTDFPAPRSDELEVDSGTIKRSATVAHKIRKSNCAILASSDSTETPATICDDLGVDSGTTKEPATVEHKTRKYKHKRSASPFTYRGDAHTSLLSQYFTMSCDQCDTLLSSWRNTREHYRDFHDLKRGYLICCGKKYSNLPLMLSHCEWHMNPDAFKCAQCSKTFQDKYCLLRHYNLTHAPGMFNCNDCDKKFSQLHFLKAHQRQRHTQSPKCPICQKCFTGKMSLRYHIRDEHSLEDEREFRNNKRLLMKVEQVKDEAKPFSCDICGSRFVLLSYLKKHIDRIHVHRNAYSNICEICAKPFKSVQNYERHFIQCHTNETNESAAVQCDICGKWLKHKHKLYEHMRYHSSYVATCKTCGHVARNQKRLSYHMKIVHRKASLECVVCGKMLKHKQGLKEHMAIHAGITDLYTCIFCTKTFRSNANMYSHRKRAHPAELEKMRKLKDI